MKYFNVMMMLGWCTQVGLMVWGWSLGRLATDAFLLLVVWMVAGLVLVGVTHYLFVSMDKPKNDRSTYHR